VVFGVGVCVVVLREKGERVVCDDEVEFAEGCLLDNAVLDVLLFLRRNLYFINKRRDPLLSALVNFGWVSHA